MLMCEVQATLITVELTLPYCSVSCVNIVFSDDTCPQTDTNSGGSEMMICVSVVTHANGMHCPHVRSSTTCGPNWRLIGRLMSVGSGRPKRLTACDCEVQARPHCHQTELHRYGLRCCSTRSLQCRHGLRCSSTQSLRNRGFRDEHYHCEECFDVFV